MSVYQDILNAVKTKVQTLGLVPNAQVVVRRLPRAEERLDTLPAILIVPSQDKGQIVEELSFEGYHIQYPVAVVVIQGNKGDTISFPAQLATWRESIIHLINSPTAISISSAPIWDRGIDPDALLDNSVLLDTYDWSSVHLIFHTSEDR